MRWRLTASRLVCRALALLTTVACVLCESGSAAADPGYPAFATVAGQPWLEGKSVLLLVESGAPGLSEILVFRRQAGPPVWEGHWESVGWHYDEAEFALEESGQFASSGCVTVGGQSVAAGFDMSLVATSGVAVVGAGPPIAVYGMVAAGRVEIARAVACPHVRFYIPMGVRDSLPVASAVAAGMASNASGEAGPDEGSGVNQACFDAAQSESDCKACMYKCYRDASRRHNVCRAGCTYFEWSAIAAGGAVGLAAVGCSTALVGAPAGLIIGGIGAAILAKAACLDRCDRIWEADGHNCANAYRVCALVHP